MKPYNAYGVSSFQATLHGGLVDKIDGMYLGATANIYLLVFDTNTTPANGAVPVKFLGPLNAQSPFYYEFKHNDLALGLGCFIGLSSTAGTYTPDGSDTMNVSVEMRDPDLPASVSFAGDLATPVTSLQVWSEASGAAARKSLVTVEVDGTSLTGGTQYLMLFAQDAAPTTGQAPVSGCVWPITAGQVRTAENKLTFGEFGRQVFSIDGEPGSFVGPMGGTGTGDNNYVGDNSPGTKRLGCTLYISRTPTTYTACNGTALIKAEYRTEP